MRGGIVAEGKEYNYRLAARLARSPVVDAGTVVGMGEGRQDRRSGRWRWRVKRTLVHGAVEVQGRWDGDTRSRLCPA
jgi:hypothetical protein